MAVVINGTTGVSSPNYQSTACIYENAQTITSNYTVSTSYNAMSAGTITIDTGVTVTVPTSSRWVIV
jgi:hypothetical protein